MTDIVADLRTVAKWASYFASNGPCDLLTNAAAEISALRLRVQELEDAEKKETP